MLTMAKHITLQCCIKKRKRKRKQRGSGVYTNFYDSMKKNYKRAQKEDPGFKNLRSKPRFKKRGLQKGGFFKLVDKAVTKAANKTAKTMVKKQKGGFVASYAVNKIGKTIY